jgi:hypothetical protein
VQSNSQPHYTGHKQWLTLKWQFDTYQRSYLCAACSRRSVVLWCTCTCIPCDSRGVTDCSYAPGSVMAYPAAHMQRDILLSPPAAKHQEKCSHPSLQQ